MKRILALDPANRTGWAHSNGQHGIWQLDTGGKGEHPGLRLQRLQDNVRRIVKLWGIDEIAFEDASFGAINANTKAQHNAVRGAILLVALELGSLPVRSYKPGVIKSHATGNYFAPKEQMIAACRTLLGINVQDDNEADALWILDMAQKGLTDETKKKRAERLAGVKPKPKARKKKAAKTKPASSKSLKDSYASTQQGALPF